MRKPMIPSSGPIRRRSLLLAALAFILVMIVWQIPALSGVLYPFRFYVTSVHELSHGLAAILTGGQFLAYTVQANGAGVATTAGGARWVIIQAGYVGTALFGALLFYVTNRTRHTKLLAGLVGVLFAALTVLFARSPTALLAGGLTAAALILLGWKASPAINTFVLNVLAILTGLNALLDLWGLLGSLDSRLISGLGDVPNDAYSMSREVGLLPPAVWAGLWIGLAALLLGLSAYHTFWRPFRQR